MFFASNVHIHKISESVLFYFQMNQHLLEQQQNQNEEIKKLKQALAAAQTEISQKNAENHRLRKQIEQHIQSAREWEEKTERQTFKNVRAHETIFAQGRTIKQLEENYTKLRDEIKMFPVHYSALELKNLSLVQKAGRQAKELDDKDTTLDILKTANQKLKDLIEEANEKAKTEHAKNEGLVNTFIRYRRKVYEIYERDVDVLCLLRQLETNVRPKQRQFWKCSSTHKDVTMKILQELLGIFSEAPLQLNWAPPKCF